MTKEEATQLLNRYEQGRCSAEEKALIESWYLSLSQSAAQTAQEPDLAYWQARISKNLPLHKSEPKRLWTGSRMAGLAAAVAAITLGIWLYYASHKPTLRPNSVIAVENDIAPGKNTATLILADGKAISLDTSKTSLIVADSLKFLNSAQVGTANAADKTKRLGMASVSTPRGGQYQVVLPDGSRVWLNSASSIRFPADLDQAALRNVQITGEVYFEVAKDQKRPFIVQSTHQRIEVLGTHFNVNDYAPKGTTTTLMEGSVLVSENRNAIASARPSVLKPGQQAVTTENHTKITQADTEAAMAWKNGYFSFQNTPINEVMEVLSRWYNVDVELGRNLTKEGFTGKFSRSRNISEVLRMLEKTGSVSFAIEGRRVIVRK